MTSVVADTHALVWHLTSPRRLGRDARRVLGDADAGRVLCHVPVVSLLEIALLHERGRLRVGVAQVLDAIASHPGYSVLPLDIGQVFEFETLLAVRDPMDRLVLAAARATGSRIVTGDDALRGHGVAVVWG